MNWITNTVLPKIQALVRREVPDNLWHKCVACGQMIFHRDLEQNLHVCPECGHHLRIGPIDRLKILFDDAKDKELIYLHAQKDMTSEVLHNRTATVTQDEKLTVSKGDRTVEVSEGKETYSVKKTRDVTVTGKETHTNKADFDQTVDGNMSLTVKGNYSLTVQGSITIKATGAVTIESSTGAVTVKAAQSLETSGMTISNKATTSLTNDGGMSITNTAQGKAALESSGMVTINGTMVKIN